MAAAVDSKRNTPSEQARRVLGTLRVRTVRHELLDRTLIWNQRQLRRLLDDYLAHYNAHRPHRCLGQRAPTDQGDAAVSELDQPIMRTTTCAGLINEYRPAA
jgi:hypothetical protein